MGREILRRKMRGYGIFMAGGFMGHGLEYRTSKDSCAVEPMEDPKGRILAYRMIIDRKTGSCTRIYPGTPEEMNWKMDKIPKLNLEIKPADVYRK